MPKETKQVRDLPVGKLLTVHFPGGETRAKVGCNCLPTNAGKRSVFPTNHQICFIDGSLPIESKRNWGSTLFHVTIETPLATSSLQ